NALTMEFTALANHRKAIRAEIAASAERYRAQLREGFRSVFERYRVGGGGGAPSPVVSAVLMTGVSQILVMEQAVLGMSTGHAETAAFVEELLTRLEGPRRPPGAA
ncbi:MAG TPA: hypothetical protein VEH29_04925, partial [Acidimicrobiales bacterium]|nr:hypothetical protein [Acidimicrobiales bacterium]